MSSEWLWSADVVAFGGSSSCETWLWNRRLWFAVQDMGPEPRVRPATGWDPVRNRGVLFGGSRLGDAHLGDTWELTPPSA